MKIELDKKYKIKENHHNHRGTLFEGDVVRVLNIYEDTVGVEDIFGFRWVISKDKIEEINND